MVVRLVCVSVYECFCVSVCVCVCLSVCVCVCVCVSLSLSLSLSLSVFVSMGAVYFHSFVQLVCFWFDEKNFMLYLAFTRHFLCCSYGSSGDS